MDLLRSNQSRIKPLSPMELAFQEAKSKHQKDVEKAIKDLFGKNKDGRASSPEPGDRNIR